MNIVIPSAGKGSRFKELGRLYPKSLLPIDNKPIIQHNIEKLYDLADSITIVIQPESLEIFSRILGYYKTFDKVVFAHPNESKNNGALTSIWAGNKENDLDYLIVLSDIILPELNVDFSTNFVTYQSVDDWERWCLVDIKTNLLSDKPKQRPNFDLNALNGVYFSKSSDFKKIAGLLECDQVEETNISSWLNLIDFKSIEMQVADFGTLQEYQENRKVPKCRHFNSIEENGNILRKSGQDFNKIHKEYNWFNSIPTNLKQHTVRIYGCQYNPFSYDMESISYKTLREHILFVGMDHFEEFLETIKVFIDTERKYQGSPFFERLFNKTNSRMKGIFTDDEISIMLSELKKYESVIDENTSIMHGDLVASNIFYKEDTKDLKLIDPNGELFGSFLYDLAKLNQSLTTPYDYIDSGLFIENYVYEKSQNQYAEKWKEFLNENYPEFVRCIEVLSLSLMCSLIPLHSDRPENQDMYIRWCKDRLKETQ